MNGKTVKPGIQALLAYDLPENIHANISLVIDIDMKKFCYHFQFWSFERVIWREFTFTFELTTLNKYEKCKIMPETQQPILARKLPRKEYLLVLQ